MTNKDRVQKRKIPPKMKLQNSTTVEEEIKEIRKSLSFMSEELGKVAT